MFIHISDEPSQVTANPDDPNSCNNTNGDSCARGDTGHEYATGGGNHSSTGAMNGDGDSTRYTHHHQNHPHSPSHDEKNHKNEDDDMTTQKDEKYDNNNNMAHIVDSSRSTSRQVSSIPSSSSSPAPSTLPRRGTPNKTPRGNITKTDTESSKKAGKSGKGKVKTERLERVVTLQMKEFSVISDGDYE